MNTIWAVAAAGFALSIVPALASSHDPHHDHRHGARTQTADLRPQRSDLTLLEAAQYVSAQVPGAITHAQAHPGAPHYEIDVNLLTGASARFQVDARNGRIEWRELPTTID